MAKVSNRMFFKRLKAEILKTFKKIVIVSVIFSVLCFGLTFLLPYSYIKILRVVGFGIMLAGAYSKMGAHSLNNGGTYRLLMTSNRMKNKGRFEQDTLMSSNSFLITCVLSGSAIFAFSILLSDYILK